MFDELGRIVCQYVELRTLTWTFAPCVLGATGAINIVGQCGISKICQMAQAPMGEVCVMEQSKLDQMIKSAYNESDAAGAYRLLTQSSDKCVQESYLAAIAKVRDNSFYLSVSQAGRGDGTHTDVLNRTPGQQAFYPAITIIDVPDNCK
jgi:hypothetical protein